MFQTPSERGGIVLAPRLGLFGSWISRFKPLQNGAVLCCRYDFLFDNADFLFQTPSERGGIVLMKLLQCR